MSANENPPTKSTGRGLNITLWVLQILLALFFLSAALGKLAGQQAAVDMFDKIGYGGWFRYFTGSVELAGAIGLVIPRLSSLAAAGLGIVMLCASVANVVYLDMAWAVAQTIPMAVIFGFIAWGRRDENRKLLAMVRR